MSTISNDVEIDLQLRDWENGAAELFFFLSMATPSGDDALN